MDESYILYIRNELGEFVPIPAIKGERGIQGLPGTNGTDGKDSEVRYRSVTLEASLWSNSTSPYTQTFDIDGVDGETLVSLALSVTNVQDCIAGEYSLLVVNNNGIVTFYCVGNKPSYDIVTNVVLTGVVN